MVTTLRSLTLSFPQGKKKKTVEGEEEDHSYH
jgi:hypothetical protein